MAGTWIGTVTALAANRRLELTARSGALVLTVVLVVGALIGVLAARTRAETDRALAVERAQRLDELERMRDRLETTAPPLSATPPPSTPTRTPTARTPTPTGSLPEPSPPMAGIPSYDRDLFGDWIDADGDCQDTRAEVLTAETVTPVVGDCTIASGTWNDPYTGKQFTIARQLDVDHLVPLANAWTSGAWAWPPAQRVAFANELADPVHLIAVSASANRSKGDRSPDQWRPPNRAYWCEYAADWIEVKTRWRLATTTSERSALLGMLADC